MTLRSQRRQSREPGFVSLPAARPIIDLERDELVPIQELCRRQLGKRVSPATLWRWLQRGVKGGKLEGVYAAGQWLTTPAAFADFLRRTTAAKLGQPIDASDDELAAAGLTE
jgi:hypothetical protein